MKKVTNIKDVREALAEAAETAWIDKSFVNRAVIVVNAMGKINASIALELKAAELSKKEPNIEFLKYKD
jgi:hypothetical protein